MKGESYHQTVSVYPRAEHAIRARRAETEAGSVTASKAADKRDAEAAVTSSRSNPPTRYSAPDAHLNDSGADAVSVGSSKPRLLSGPAQAAPGRPPAYGHAQVPPPGGSKLVPVPDSKPAGAHPGLDAVQMSLQDMLAAAARIQSEFLSSSGSRAPTQQGAMAASQAFSSVDQPAVLAAAPPPRPVAAPQTRGPLEALRDELFGDLTLPGRNTGAAPAVPSVGVSTAATVSLQSPVTRRRSWTADPPIASPPQSVAALTEQGAAAQLQEEMSATLTAQAGHSYADLSSIYSIPDSTFNAAARTPMSFTTAAVSELDTPSSARSRDEEYDKSFASPRSSPERERAARMSSGRRLASGRMEYDRITSGYDDYVSPASWMSLREQHSTSHAQAASTVSGPGLADGGDGAGSVTSTPTGPSAWASGAIDLVGSTSVAALPPPPPVSPVASMSSVSYTAPETDGAPTTKARTEDMSANQYPRHGVQQQQPQQTDESLPPPRRRSKPDIVGLVDPHPLSLSLDSSLGAHGGSSPSSSGLPTATGFGSIVIAAGPDSGWGRERTSSGHLYRSLSFGVPSCAASIISSGTGSRSGEDGGGGYPSGPATNATLSAAARRHSVGPTAGAITLRRDDAQSGGHGEIYGDAPHSRHGEVTFTNPLFVRDGESSQGGLSSVGGGGGMSSSADGSVEARGGKGVDLAVTPPPTAREAALAAETETVADESKVAAAARTVAALKDEPEQRGMKRGMDWGRHASAAAEGPKRNGDQASISAADSDITVPTGTSAEQRLTSTHSGAAAASRALMDIATLSSTTSTTDTDGNSHLLPLDPARPPSVAAALVPASPPPAQLRGAPAIVNPTVAMAAAAPPPPQPLGTAQTGGGATIAAAEPAELQSAPSLGVSAAALCVFPEQDRVELVRSWAQVRADFAAKPQGSSSHGGATSSTPLTPEPSNGCAAVAVHANRDDGSAAGCMEESVGAGFLNPEALPAPPQQPVPPRSDDSGTATAAGHPVSVRAVTGTMGTGPKLLWPRQQQAGAPLPHGGRRLEGDDPLDHMLSVLSGRGARSEGHDQVLLSDTLRSAIFEAVSMPRPNSAPVLVFVEETATGSAHEGPGKPPARRVPHPTASGRGHDPGEQHTIGSRDVDDAGATARSLGRSSVGTGLPEHPHPHRQPHLPLNPHSHVSLLQLTQQQQVANGGSRAPLQAAAPAVAQVQASGAMQSISPSGSLGSIDSEVAAERLKAKMRAYLQSAEAAVAASASNFAVPGAASMGALDIETSSEASMASALGDGDKQLRQHECLQPQGQAPTLEAAYSFALANMGTVTADGPNAAAAMGMSPHGDSAAAMAAGGPVAGISSSPTAAAAAAVDLAIVNTASLESLLRRASLHLQAATDPTLAATGTVHSSLAALEDILRQLQLLTRSSSAGGDLLAVAAGPAALPPRPPAGPPAEVDNPANEAVAGVARNYVGWQGSSGGGAAGGGSSGGGGGSISAGGFGGAGGSISASVGGFSGASGGSGGLGGEWSTGGQRLASSVGSVSLWAGSAGTGSTRPAPSRGSRAVSSPSRLGLQGAGARAAAASHAPQADEYPAVPQPVGAQPSAPYAVGDPSLAAEDHLHRKGPKQERPDQTRRWAQPSVRASLPADYLRARGGGDGDSGAGAPVAGPSYLELAAHATKLREQMEVEVRQSPPRQPGTEAAMGQGQAAQHRQLLSPPYSDVGEAARPQHISRRHSQPGSPQQARGPAHSAYAQQHQQPHWQQGVRSASHSGEATAMSKPEGPVDWQAALQSKLLPYDAVRDRELLIDASAELPGGAYTALGAGAGPVVGDGEGLGAIPRGPRSSAGGRQSRPVSPGLGRRAYPRSARAAAPSAAHSCALQSAPVTPRRGNSPARNAATAAVVDTDAAAAAAGSAAAAAPPMPPQYGQSGGNFGLPSKSPRAGSNVRDSRGRSGSSGSILDRATPQGAGGIAGSSVWAFAAAAAGGGAGSSTGGGGGNHPQPTRSPSPAESEPIVILRPFAWQERETRNWLEDIGLLVNPSDEVLPLLDNPLRNGLLLAALAARLVGSPLPAGVVTVPPRDMRSARTNILCALDHMGMLAAPWAPPPDAERRARAQAAAADMASAAGAVNGGGASSGGASASRSRSPSPSRKNAAGPTMGSSGIIAIKALGSAGRGYALRLKERQLRAGLGLVAEVESVLAGSPDSIWGLLNFIRLAIAPQYQYLRRSGAGAGPGGGAGARSWGHGAGGESLRRTFDVRGGAGPDGTLGLGPAPAALAAATAAANGGPATNRSGRASPSRSAGAGSSDAGQHAGTEGGGQQAGPSEGTPTLRGGGRAPMVTGRSRIPGGPIADPRGSIQITGTASHVPGAASAAGGAAAQVTAADSGLLYRPLWPHLASLPYSPGELTALESSLLMWLVESGAISRREAAQGFPALLRMFEDGTFICWLVSNLSGKPIVGAHRRPLTDAARRTNWLKAIEALRTTPGMSRRFLVYEEALIHCERPPLTGLLEDLHRLAGGLPPAPSAILPDAKPYLPYTVPEPEIRTLPADRIAINRGSPSASPRPHTPTPGRSVGPEPPSRRSTASPSPRETPSRHRHSGLVSNGGNAVATTTVGAVGGIGTYATAPPVAPAAAPHLQHPLFQKTVPGPSCIPSSPSHRVEGHYGHVDSRDEHGVEGAGGGLGGGHSARGDSPAHNSRLCSGGAAAAASGVRRASVVNDSGSLGASGRAARSLITDIMVTPTKVAPAAIVGPSELRRQRLASSTSIDLLRASYPAAAWGADADFGVAPHQPSHRNKRIRAQQHGGRLQQGRGSRSAGGAAEVSPVSAALSPRLRLVPSAF